MKYRIFDLQTVSQWSICMSMQLYFFWFLWTDCRCAHLHVNAKILPRGTPIAPWLLWCDVKLFTIHTRYFTSRQQIPKGDNCVLIPYNCFIHNLSLNYEKLNRNVGVFTFQCIYICFIVNCWLHPPWYWHWSA